MNCKATLLISEPILQLQRQLDQFRSTQPRRTKLPEPLWQAAVELARQHGVYPVAHPLRLDYTRRKERLGGIPNRRRKARKPAFVELVAPFGSSGGLFRRVRVLERRQRCASNGRHPRRPIGRAYCEPGGMPSDDSDHSADARAGGHRAGGRKKRHRFPGSVVPGTPTWLSASVRQVGSSSGRKAPRPPFMSCWLRQALCTLFMVR